MDRRHLLSVAVCILALSYHTYAQRTSPPKIVKQSPTYYVVIPDNEATIECEATGTPAPTYRWQRNDMDLVMDEDFSLNGGNLEVADATKATNGIYRCLAENQYGVAMSNKINFTIAFSRGFKDSDMSTFTFTEGDLATIPCNQKESVPEPSIFWTDDANPGNEIVMDNRVSIDPEYNLRFSNILTSDTGNYQCNVKNDKLRVQRLSPVKTVVVRSVENVPYRPASLVYTPPSSVDAFRTKKLRLKCMAEGFPTPTISWAKENEPLPAERTTLESFDQELVISDVTETDAGVYICTATNGEGTPTEYKTTVVVKSTPYWINKPEDINVVINDGGILLCEAAGIPVPNVRWMINGVPNSEADPNPRRTITEGVGGGRVMIEDALTEDSAVFLCVAENEHGEISASGFVNVESIPAEMTTAPSQDVITIEGKGFDLTCAGQGSPKPQITWIFKTNTLAPDGSKYDIVEDGNSRRTTSTLTVSGVTVEDSGDYKCSIENGFGEVPASSLVTVRRGTKIVVGPNATVEVRKNEDAIIVCEVDHDEALTVTVTWFRDVGAGREELDLSVSGGRFKKTGKDNLKVLDSVVEDTGTYECKAVTSEDEASASAQLVILTVPASPSGLSVSPRSDVADTMVALSWTSGDNGNSPVTDYVISYETDWPDLGWQVMVTVPASSTQTSLDLSPWVNYRFRVVAVNKIGSSDPSESSQDYQTSPAALTEAPEEVGLEPTDPGMMRVTWPEVHPYNQNGPGFKYVVKWREPGSIEWTTEEIDDYRITNYEIDGGGNYKQLEVQVFYENDEGAGPAVEQTSFTGEGTPTEAPQNVQVTPESPTQVVVTWDAVSDLSVNGRLKSFLVYFTMLDAQAQGQGPTECLPNTDCRVTDLTPFQHYWFQVSVKNGQREGAKSVPAKIKMPEGQAGQVVGLTVEALSDRLLMTWAAPALPNGVINGYNVSYQTFNDKGVLGNTTTVLIPDPKSTSYKVSPAEPGTEYRIVVLATNGFGQGLPDDKEVSTRAAGKPPVPLLVEDQIDPGKDYINVTFVQEDGDGPAANTFYVMYKEKNDKEFLNSEPMDLLDGTMIQVTGLTPSTEYTLVLVAENDDGPAEGVPKDTKTLGNGTAGGGGARKAQPFTVEAWFIILLIIIVALLCILLVLCILKSQRGGKYNVSDKEKQRKGDIESTPLKDEGGFEEFEPHKTNPEGELPRGSQGSLRDSEPGSSDTDSLKEYADGELGKFNEEGSFIGQYGDKKQRPTDDAEQGGAAYSTFV